MKTNASGAAPAPQPKSQDVVLAHLQSLSPSAMVEDPKVADRFVKLYDRVHGSKDGELFYHREKFNFMKVLSENKDLAACTKLSLYGAFLDVAVNGLSFEKGKQPLAYLLFRNANAGTQQNPQWEKRAYLEVSPYGELLMRMRAGHIRHADNPIIIYEGDNFSPSIVDGKKSVSYEMVLPHTGKKCVGAFIRITRMDGTVDFEWLIDDDIARLKGYSNRNNHKGNEDAAEKARDKSNALYRSYNGGIDPGFLAAKMIKHAFRTYPKVKVGAFSELKSVTVDEPLDYGLDTTKVTGALPENAAAAVADPGQSFGPQDEPAAPSVTVTLSPEDGGGQDDPNAW